MIDTTDRSQGDEGEMMGIRWNSNTSLKIEGGK